MSNGQLLSAIDLSANILGTVILARDVEMAVWEVSKNNIPLETL